jgi:hypothetical protein
LGLLGLLGIPHGAREAGGANMPMTRHASVRAARVTKFVTKIGLPPIRVTKFVTKFR